jgi:hypothetical protein
MIIQAVFANASSFFQGMDWVQSIGGLSNHPKTITLGNKNLLFSPIGAKWKVIKL